MPDTQVAAPTAPLSDAATMEDVIQTTLLQSSATPDQPSGDRQRDEHGRFVPVQPVEGTAPVSPSGEPGNTEEGGASVEDAPITVPDGYTLAAALPDERARGFVVKDAEGEIVPPDLTWELTAGGKPRTLSTDTLIEYAKMGVYNHDLQQSYEQSQVQLRTMETETQSLHEVLQQRDQQIERLLTDPDYLVDVMRRYEAYNTPEAQAQRARQDLEQTQATYRLQQMEQQAEQFVNTELSPAIETIQATCPMVSFDELAAWLYQFSDQYREQGVLRPDGYQPVQQYILTHLIPRAQQLHASRLEDRTTVTTAAEDARKKAESDALAARLRLQKTKRVTAPGIKPGNGATPTSQPHKPIRTQKEADEDVITSTLASVR